jgi:tripartite ATP-independent transporter DctP family solute receptor
MPLTRRTFAVGTAVATVLPSIFIPRVPAFAAEFTLKCGITTAPSHPVSVRLMEASKRIATQTNGRVDLQVFPASQMGGDVDMLSQTHSGALQFQLISGITAAVMVPGAAISGIGFAFKDYDQVWAAMDGDLGASIRQDYDKGGFYVAPQIWDNGFRQLTTSSRQVKTVSDVKGLKIRVPPAPLWVSLWRAFGAGPTTIDLSEVYSALQTKIVDGQENPLPLIDSNKIYEVQKYCALTSHQWDGWWMLGHKPTWNKLPDDLKEIISRNISQSTLDERADVRATTKMLQEKLSAAGLTFNEPDRESFRDMLQSTTYYKDWRAKFGDKAWDILQHYCGTLS